MNRHKIFIAITLFELGLCALLFLTSLSAVQTALRQQIGPQQQLVGFLALTDLAIWTEARYTRHPSQTDFFTPFQDFPASLEHFPAGSIISPRQTVISPRQTVISPQDNGQHDLGNPR